MTTPSIRVTKINISDINNARSIAEILSKKKSHSINKINWGDKFPISNIDVSFKIAHDEHHIFLQYFVEEKEIMAMTKEDNGSVWTDSCVEFFLSFEGSPYYYNAEFSCIGTALLGCRKIRTGSSRASSFILSNIKRYPSLGKDTFNIKKGDYKWNLLLVIPTNSFWMNEIQSLSGVKAKANFYKCGDGLNNPHYLSWSKIDTENPDFHSPSFFGNIYFE